MIRKILLAAALWMFATGTFAQVRSFPGPGSNVDGTVAYTTASLPRFRLALAAVKRNTADAVVNCVGDSITAGLYATGPIGTNARVTSYCNVLAQELANLGIPTSNNSFFGDANSASLAAYDPRITIGAGWAPNTGIFPRPPGGNAQFNSTTANNLSFAPTGAVDTCDVYYLVDPTYGGITIQSDGGSTTAVSETATRGYAKTTLSMGSPGTHVLNVARTSGNVNISGADCYNSTSHVVRIRNFGISGATSANLIATTQAYMTGVVFGAGIVADLWINNIGVNDAAAGTAGATMQANITTLGTNEQRSTSDIVYIQPFPSAVAGVTAPNEAALYAAVLASANAKNAPMFSWAFRVIDWNTAVTNGFAAAGDNLHPTIAGYNDFGVNMADLFKKVF